MSRSHHTFTKKIKVFYIMSNQTDWSDLTDLKKFVYQRSTKDDQRLTDINFDH